MATSVAFVDSRVAGFLPILGDDSGERDWYVLSADEEGVAQMRRILAGYSDLESIHVVSHGTEGTLLLGSTRLDAAGLASQTTALADIGSALSETGDLLLYGCDVAGGAAGQAFIDELSFVESSVKTKAIPYRALADALRLWHPALRDQPIEGRGTEADVASRLLATHAARRVRKC